MRVATDKINGLTPALYPVYDGCDLAAEVQDVLDGHDEATQPRVIGRSELVTLADGRLPDGQALHVQQRPDGTALVVWDASHASAEQIIAALDAAAAQ